MQHIFKILLLLEVEFKDFYRYFNREFNSIIFLIRRSGGELFDI